jgi:beta-lactamase superfamily II metal-dependent hydrolase
VYEVDFLPVGAGEKSGDAIALRFTAPNPLNNDQIVVVIDGGFTEVGSEIVNHIEKHYGTSRADLVISTHPDADHINGLGVVLEMMDVGELLLHLPDNHGHPRSVWGTDAVGELCKVAARRGVPIVEPFAGLQRFNGALTVVGPTRDYYRDLLAQQAAAQVSKSLVASLGEALQQFAKRAVSALPFVETLGEDGETTACNNSSVVTFWNLDGHKLLLTGDAGIPAMRQVADLMIAAGHGPYTPLTFFQAPHHGSRRNLAPSILDDLLGSRHAPYSTDATVFISASKDAPKHPSPKVTNALQRRGCSVFTSERGIVSHHKDALLRPGWGPATPVGPLDEGEEED